MYEISLLSLATDHLYLWNNLCLFINVHLSVQLEEVYYFQEKSIMLPLEPYCSHILLQLVGYFFDQQNCVICCFLWVSHSHPEFLFLLFRRLECWKVDKKFGGIQFWSKGLDVGTIDNDDLLIIGTFHQVFYVVQFNFFWLSLF